MPELFVVVGSSVVVVAAASDSSTVFVAGIQTVAVAAVVVRAVARNISWPHLVAARSSPCCRDVAAVVLARKAPKEQCYIVVVLAAQILPDLVHIHRSLAVDHSPVRAPVVQGNHVDIEVVAASEEVAACKALVGMIE